MTNKCFLCGRANPDPGEELCPTCRAAARNDLRLEYQLLALLVVAILVAACLATTTVWLVR